MKIAEIRELSTSELVERLETEQASYKNMVMKHDISPL